MTAANASEYFKKKLGEKYVRGDLDSYHLEVVPTGSLMLDYKLGIGGFPYGAGVEVFGTNKIGKSSAIAYPVIGNVQKQGKRAVLLAMEPRLTTEKDVVWATKMGVDVESLSVIYPDNAENAFDILREIVYNHLGDYIVIDSLGSMAAESSAKVDGDKKAYGISGVVTDGLNAIMPRLFKNNIGLLIVNQQRQAGSYRPGMMYYESPGGEALKHHMRIRIQMKPGKNKYEAEVDGEKIVVGREIVCVMIKNNMEQAQERVARFDFYNIATEDHDVGIDRVQDVINVGIMTGVIDRNGTWFEHHLFPGKLQKVALRDFLRENPEVLDKIRLEVLSK